MTSPERASAPAPHGSEASSTTHPGSGRVDVRGPRFGAALTAVVLATALLVQGPVGTLLVGVQVVVFAVAVIGGVPRSPWAVLFRVLRDRLDWGPPPALEDATPPRFAQACGLAVAGAGLVALLVGASVVGWVAVGVVLALATLLATTGICVGCELWLLGARVRDRGTGGVRA